MRDNYQLPKEGGLIEGAEPEDIVCRYEKIKTTVAKTETEGVALIADQMVAAIESKSAEGKMFVMALTSGNSPVGVYRALVEKYRCGEASFDNVVVFSLDELYPIDGKHQQSQSYKLHSEFLDHVDIRPENIHMINASIPIEQVHAYCRKYEAQIAALGGIDMAMIGVGSKGQIGYNEAGAFYNTRTRLVAMSNISRKKVADSFFGAENAPSKAITMGIGTILEARRILIPAWGEGKAWIIERITEGEITQDLPASYLQSHSNIEIVADESAAENLTRFKTPWLVGTCDWQP